MRALDDILVLDLSRVLAGPFCTQMLADLGAKVIKVEKPGSGDDTRGWGPPFLADPETAEKGDAAYYLAANRGKHSVTIDLAKPEGQELIRALAAKADVLVENYKLGGLAKYGLDYASLKTINPRLVYCSITGFGQDGPYAPRAGYDFMIQAMGGMMSVTGEKDGLPGGGPQKAGIAIADLSTGLHAVIAVLAALNQRHRTGRGQYIDLGLLDVQVSMMSNQAMTYLVSGKAPGRAGNGHAAIVPYQAFATMDGHLIIAVGNDGQFAKLADELGHPEWAEDERFALNRTRVEHRDVLTPLIEAETRRYDSAQLLEALERRQIPCGPINTMDKVFADPQAKARGLDQEVPHARAGTIPTVASPLRLSDSPVLYDRGPPLLGEHTESVLTEMLGLDSAMLAALRDKGVV
ncbi:L-carnitine dehydratase/bile acid-inducible protein F [Paramagnetospirillum magnetotacticum MS-1]|uniref:L-carnitine dehydratase/bile acid-inducible protein F n=1 Tax=Paramagnetospirillum magnetotacticum MS-1 TaxID=272627 RepID=A0A0C2V1T3_PARME|nr:CaiB/BaiF CoA-transferase family protein [Paramagnetospirillum magnetotacticum]KIL99046.1 L-carnitine dehydratase/bile acid-inducible protein F [Paramagnetospirillum magnetotacticum MS-1]